MFMRQAALTFSLLLSSSTLFIGTAAATVAPTAPVIPVTTAAVTPAVTTPPTTTAQPTTTTTQPTLRQNSATTPLPATTLASLQQKHKLELAEQEKRLSTLEKANQEALTQNQELQISNNSLAVQVQVLQSERSAQMFLYGAVTFGVGTIFGLILYGVLYTRRRRSW